MKQLIDEMNGNEKSHEPSIKKGYAESLKSLKKIAPESKHKDIDGMLKILEEGVA